MSPSGDGPPPPGVLRAFGAEGRVERLPGGQGTSWRAGALVLKPAGDEESARWLADTLRSVVCVGVRVTEPVPAADGRWVVDGWTAARWVAGDVGPVGRWPALLDAGRAFHAAVRHVPRPGFLDARSDPWARADRSAWGESAPPAVPGLRSLRRRLVRLTEPVTEPSQLVHGDLSGNVLFSPGRPPTVIDVSPYWRPQAFAEAVVVADGVLWWGEGAELVAAAGRGGRPAWLARGLLFRLDTMGHQLAEAGASPSADDVAPFDAATRLVEVLEASRAGHGPRRGERG